MRATTKYKLVVRKLLDTLLDDEEFCADFCADCPMVPRNAIDECVAGWCPTEPSCYRRARWKKIEEAISNAVRG